MHGLHTEHTAADKLSEHTEEMDSEKQSDYLSDNSNTTEMIQEFNEMRFETKPSEQ